ncbi:helix-turn-helix protein [Flavobacterium sp. 90]|uniref:helix-turn-helix domain-containing protein n=1 Tax=unclassified Flavobacterium TaxID=196869 RepID=UPI000EACAA3C|nr:MULTISPECIES: helix-turn-helix domain-containing protein [unclassified Flavobacterium]RKR05074.1 helix-turn-helix protein [Flavobacterium sp. 81]TCK56390.1 helix-turn-helix protein [Flavobacterium sp. 90]
MKKEIPIFKTPKEISDWFGLPSTELISNDFMIQEIDKWNKNKLLTVPDNYKANFFTILIINKGSATHLFNDKIIKLEASGIFLTCPGHYRNYKFDHLTEAHFISFTEKFLASHCFSDIYKEFPFLLSESLIYTKADPENYDAITYNTNQIKREIQRNPEQKMLLIGNMVEFLLIKIKELFQNPLHPFTDNSNSTVNTFYKDLGNYFNEIVQGKKPKQLKTKDFADLQFLNEDYFSRVIKTKTGRTPTTWINSRLLLEVKLLLTETSMPITEIADLFQFTNSRYFNFYFKSQTTLTPAFYRKSLHKS